VVKYLRLSALVFSLVIAPSLAQAQVAAAGDRVASIDVLGSQRIEPATINGAGIQFALWSGSGINADVVCSVERPE